MNKRGTTLSEFGFYTDPDISSHHKAKPRNQSPGSSDDPGHSVLMNCVFD
jgi:hypothetical protein